MKIIIGALCFVIGMWVGRITTISINTYDMPEEFNEFVISQDTLKPTKMDVVYVDSIKTYLFKFSK